MRVITSVITQIQGNYYFVLDRIPKRGDITYYIMII